MTPEIELIGTLLFCIGCILLGWGCSATYIAPFMKKKEKDE